MVVVHAENHARSAQQEHQQHECREVHADRKALDADGELQRAPQERGDGHGQDNLHGLVHGGVFPQTVVQMKCGEHQHVHDCQDADGEQHVRTGENLAVHVRHPRRQEIGNIGVHHIQAEQQGGSLGDANGSVLLLIRSSAIPDRPVLV